MNSTNNPAPAPRMPTRRITNSDGENQVYYFCILFGVVLILLGGVCGLSAYRQISKNLILQNRGVTATVTVTDYRITELRNRESYKMILRLTLPDGRQMPLEGLSSSPYVTSTFSSLFSRPGDPKLDIIYDPQNPQRFHFAKDHGVTGKGYLMAGYTLLLLTVGLLLTKFGISSIKSEPVEDDEP